MFERISDEQKEELLTWIDAFEFSKPSKHIGRDFSDAVLSAEILKKLFPKIVDLHNYQSCNSFVNKIDNWNTLNRKVLRKINVTLDHETIVKLAEANIAVVESVLYELMKKCQLALTMKSSNMNHGSSDSQGSDIFTVNVEHRVGDQVESTSQKMILYSLYQQLESMLEEKNQVISILSQKNEHFENLIKLKNKRIQDLETQLKKKNNPCLQDIFQTEAPDNESPLD